MNSDLPWVSQFSLKMGLINYHNYFLWFHHFLLSETCATHVQHFSFLKLRKLWLKRKIAYSSVYSCQTDWTHQLLNKKWQCLIFYIVTGTGFWYLVSGSRGDTACCTPCRVVGKIGLPLWSHWALMIYKQTNQENTT